MTSTRFAIRSLAVISALLLFGISSTNLFAQDNSGGDNSRRGFRGNRGDWSQRRGNDNNNGGDAQQQSRQMNWMPPFSGRGNSDNNTASGGGPMSMRGPGGFGGGPMGMRGPQLMTPEQMERFRAMTPEQKMEAFRKMREQQRPKATPEPGSEIALAKAYAQPELDLDLNGSTAMAWRRLTDEQRLEMAAWSSEERQHFRQSLREFVLAPDKASTAVVERMTHFLTENQMEAIRKLTDEQHKQASSLIDGYTTAALVMREYSRLPEADREALKKLPPSEKLKYLQEHGIDTTLFRSLFANAASTSMPPPPADAPPEMPDMPPMPDNMMPPPFPGGSQPFDAITTSVPEMAIPEAQ
ncbi:hypothetical protein GX645_00465 [Candidatus Sumerlaeota bacterium]|nr:hypothetical protein [Candidatus Sumerlaeales bacterium]NLD60913.1 hypothetical protein [Candidatus Sumerlaeota bacterium]